MIGAAYLHTAIGWRPAATLTVFGTTASSGSPAFASNGNVFVNTNHPVWLTAQRTREKILTHELFHVLQSNRAWDRSLLWLVEGTAEYFGYRGAFINRGTLTEDEARSCHVFSVSQANPPLGPLSSYESASGAGPVYSLFYLAAARLAALKGIDSLATITSFEAAFDMSKQAFYQDFEAYRQSLTPPAQYVCPH